MKPRTTTMVLLIIAFNIGCTAQQVAEFERNYENERIKNEHKNQNHQNHAAKADIQTACVKKADRYWDLPNGTAISMHSISTGDGMFEVKVAAVNRRGICTVTEDGDVKGIMERMKPLAIQRAAITSFWLPQRLTNG